MTPILRGEPRSAEEAARRQQVVQYLRVLQSWAKRHHGVAADLPETTEIVTPAMDRLFDRFAVYVESGIELKLQEAADGVRAAWQEASRTALSRDAGRKGPPGKKGLGRARKGGTGEAEEKADTESTNQGRMDR